MTQAPYIPTKDADFNNWLLNFSALLTASPTTYGLTAPDATAVADVTTSWSTAYATATNPDTRTSPAVAAKDAARAAAESTVRTYAQQISKSDAVTPEDKLAIGVNIPNTTPVPIPAPTSFPQLSFRAATPLVHTLQYQDSDLGTGKQKPFGAVGIEVWRSVGTVPATDPAQASYYSTFTKSPLRVSFDAPQVGKTCTYFARWVTRSGPGGVAQKGPWSAPLTAAVI